MRRIAKLWTSAMALTMVLGALAGAQSLGDYARSVRKDKAPTNAAVKHYDNDNLPKTDHLSVVGPAPAQPADAAAGTTTDDAAGGTSQATTDAAEPGKEAPDKKDVDEERKKAAEEWQKRLQDQKERIASAEKELDILNREYRLRAVAMYADVGNRLRNSAAWDKEDREYKEQIAAKEKAVADAKQKLEDLQEQARKAGVPASARE